MSAADRQALVAELHELRQGYRGGTTSGFSRKDPIAPFGLVAVAPLELVDIFERAATMLNALGNKLDAANAATAAIALEAVDHAESIRGFNARIATLMKEREALQARVEAAENLNAQLARAVAPEAVKVGHVTLEDFEKKSPHERIADALEEILGLYRNSLLDEYGRP